MKSIIVFFIVISSVVSVNAVYFSEIMYDPQGSDTSREWVEIYNDTNSSIDFTSWKFLESGTNHGITSYSGGSSLQSGGYAVIADNPAKFLDDNSSYQGILYDSSFSLSNIGEQLVLKNGSGAIIDTVTYNPTLGGNDDGSTLSKIDEVWVRGSSTPGETNQSSPLTSNSSTTSTTTENQATILQASPPSSNIVLYLPFEKTVVAGAETEFATNGMTRDGKIIDGLTCTWAYGDGGQGTGTSTTYRYAYDGRYIAQVEGTNGYVKGIGRMVVHVVPPDITITRIGQGKYGAYVDINNPNKYDLDLSQWNLSLDGSGFPFPKNTLIAGNTITRFSGIAMGFASTTISTSTVARILFPNLEEVTRYIPPEIAKDSSFISAITSINSPVLVSKKPVIKIPQQIATSTIKLAVSTNHKDTRIVSFFKSLFGR